LLEDYLEPNLGGNCNNNCKINKSNRPRGKRQATDVNSTVKVSRLKTGSDRKQLCLMYFNARSIRNKLDELKIFVDNFNPDIIGVVETWLREDIVDSEINLDGYSFIRIDRKNDLKSKGGGVIVYIKEGLSFVII